MGRKRIQLKLLDADWEAFHHLLTTTRDLRKRERLDFVLNASTGKYTIDRLARMAGRSRSTIQNWVLKFGYGGLKALLARDAAPGKESPLASAKIQSELRNGLGRKRWATAQEVADWLHTRHGVKRSRKTIYYWLRKVDPKRR